MVDSAVHPVHLCGTAVSYGDLGAMESLFGVNAEILRGMNFQLLLFAAVLPVFGTQMLSTALDSLIRARSTSRLPTSGC